MKNQRKSINGNRQTPWLVSFIALTLILAGCVGPSATAPVETTQEVNIGTAETVPPATVTPIIPPTPATPVHMQVSAEELAGIVVTFAHPWVGEMAEAIETAATQFSLSNPYDIWVEVEAPGSRTALLDSLEAHIESGDLPGLLAVRPYELAALNGSYFSVNLTSYIDDPDWGMSTEERADIPEVFLNQFGGEGVLAALPLAPQATVLFYNQTWATELGFANAPGDDQEFRKQTCEAAFANNADDDEENDGTGGWLVNLNPQVLASWFAAFEGELPATTSPQFDSDAGLAAFGYLKSVKDEACFWVGRRPDAGYYFGNRYALAVAGTVDQIPGQTSWLSESGSQDEWSVMGFPGPGREVMLIDGPGLALTVDTPENQMAAWLFARYLLTPEVQENLVRAGFSLPVRKAAITLLEDFATDNPQWAQAVEMLDVAQALPMSEGWGIGQYVLQDAIYSLLQSTKPDLPKTLQELDAMISDLEGMAQ